MKLLSRYSKSRVDTRIGKSTGAYLEATSRNYPPPIVDMDNVIRGSKQ